MLSATTDSASPLLSPASLPDASALTHRGKMARANILLVEDDRSLLKGMSDFLELSGYQVSVAENGLEALNVLTSNRKPPDLIVSDIMMPFMDGYQLLTAVRQQTEWVSIPFIFLSAKSTRQDIRAGKKLGADDYIPKPFDVEDLLVAIQSRLERYSELDKLNENRLVTMKRRILTTLNHEFRTPLSYVIAYSDLIVNGEEELDPHELRDYLAGIHSGGERLMRLVEDFLLLVEMETGQATSTYHLRKETIIDLSDFVGKVVQSFQPEAQEAEVELNFEPVDDPPPIEGDYTFLRTAVGHLIENAIKFTTGHGSRVDVGLDVLGEEVVIWVKDDGVGVVPHKHSMVFDLFYQADRDLLERPGMGVGLTLVKHVADLHGGQVGMDSQPGKGSTFRIYLPTIE